MLRRALATGIAALVLGFTAAADRVPRPELTAAITTRLEDNTRSLIERTPSTAADTYTVYRSDEDGKKAGTWATLKRFHGGGGEFYREQLTVKSYHGVWVDETIQAAPCYTLTLPPELYNGDLGLMCVTSARDNRAGEAFDLGKPGEQVWREWQDYHRQIAASIRSHAVEVKPEQPF